VKHAAAIALLACCLAASTLVAMPPRVCAAQPAGGTADPIQNLPPAPTPAPSPTSEGDEGNQPAPPPPNLPAEPTPTVGTAADLGAAKAQAEAMTSPPSPGDSGVTLESMTCERLAAEGGQAASTAAAAAAEPDVPPVPWTEWEVSGQLIDDPAALRAVLDGAMQAHRSLTRTARQELEQIANDMGYRVLSLRSVPVSAAAGSGRKAILELEPRLLIRSVSVTTDLSLDLWRPWKPFTTVLLDDDVERRMRLRPGAYLSSEPATRACELVREREQIAEYLHDEGFFDAKVRISADLKSASARIVVHLAPGPEYRVGRITIDQAGSLALPAQEIRDQFGHEGTCIVWKLCLGTARFTRAQQQADKKRLIELYQRRGFPAVRVQDIYDPIAGFDRYNHKINFTLQIDERRRIDVVFEGHDPDVVPDDKLREQLTFAEAGSADDVEAALSAARLTTYLQGRGYFEARVTWKRERFRTLDQVVFRISMGQKRRVRRVEFTGNKHFTSEQLIEKIATRPYGSLVRLFGNAPPATSQQLQDDADSLVRAYRQVGFRRTKIEISAGPTEESLSSVALATAQISSSRADGGMYVRFRIDEGPRTLVRRLEVTLPRAEADGTLTSDRQQALCNEALAALSRALEAPRALVRLDRNRCLADANVAYLETRVDQSVEALRELLRDQARPYSTVDLEPTEDGTNVDLRFLLKNLGRRQVGKVLVRGNFRTRRSIILGELGFREGAPLTGDLSSDGQGRLRATGLFDRVAINYVDGERVSHAIVQVEERFDSRAQIDVEIGISTITNSVSSFGKTRASIPNLFGTGLSADVAATIGTELQLYESSLRIPRFLLRHLFDAELGAFWRQQNTDRFGNLLTKGITVATSRGWQREHSPAGPARAISAGLRYDFRLRDRRIESIRPAGVDSDEAQIPVTTRSGALALSFEWEQRVSRGGTLSPLSPEDGFRLEASVALASPLLLGQDTFLKVGGSAQVYWPLGKDLLLRTDLRYDHGLPLGGESVLPEVERYFAGGDSTVRGYDEDRLATEVITEPVPPFGNGDQIRVVAAGGNIRAIASVDAQVRIYGPLASALFVDAGVVTNDWRAADAGDIRPGAGAAARVILPFGAISLEYAVPLRPKLGDDPRGRIHFGFAMRFD
jgi:outer membrane protein insertion porin family